MHNLPKNYHFARAQSDSLSGNLQDENAGRACEFSERTISCGRPCDAGDRLVTRPAQQRYTVNQESTGRA